MSVPRVVAWRFSTMGCLRDDPDESRDRRPAGDRPARRRLGAACVAAARRPAAEPHLLRLRHRRRASTRARRTPDCGLARPQEAHSPLGRREPRDARRDEGRPDARRRASGRASRRAGSTSSSTGGSGSSRSPYATASGTASTKAAGSRVTATSCSIPTASAPFPAGSSSKARWRAGTSRRDATCLARCSSECATSAAA